jgi:hypothetical protein
VDPIEGLASAGLQWIPSYSTQIHKMGGGASVLSSEDFVTMSQNLKEEYEVLITTGYTDDEIREKLMEKYNELFVTSDPNVLEAISSGGESDSSAILVGEGTS